MRVISVNVGLPRSVQVNGATVRSAIWKSPVAGRVAVKRNNLAGDEQSDLRVHGGPDKAVYAYPSEHYAFWAQELPGVELPWGAFGENLTIEGLLEQDACVGDRLRVGSTELVITEPRYPCYKLGIKFEREDIIRRFATSRRTGFYLSIASEGDVAAGDAIERIGRVRGCASIAEVAERRLSRS